MFLIAILFYSFHFTLLTATKHDNSINLVSVTTASCQNFRTLSRKKYILLACIKGDRHKNVKDPIHEGRKVTVVNSFMPNNLNEDKLYISESNKSFKTRILKRLCTNFLLKKGLYKNKTVF